jgi:monoamine oxidase
MRLTMGSVLRIALHLRERFWENEKLLAPPAGQSLNKLTFLHSNDPDVPVWWTAHPVRAPLLIGWAGGPRATRLLAHSHEEIERHAIASLARQVGMSTRKLRGLVVESWMHNWDHDPFARGAYSYTLVGGFGAWSRLARPIDRTLYFAGEACDPDGQLGTVNGAIATGVRAAKLCTRALETVRAR